MNFISRLNNLQQWLQDANLDGLIVQNPVDVFYLVGIHFSSVKLLISKNDSVLVVDGRYIEIARSQLVHPTVLLNDFSLSDWIVSHSIHHLGFDSQATSFNDYLTLLNSLNDIKENGFKVDLKPIKEPILEIRMVKDDDEIEILSNAARLCVEGSRYVQTHLREGVSEEELALELEFFWKNKGAKSLSFDSIIAFGANSSMPHHRAGPTRLKDGMVVLVDIGVAFKDYQSDMTRVFYFGKKNPVIEAIYAIVAEAKHRAMLLCRPGIKIQELDDAARGYIAEKGYGEQFNHNLGHGVGLEIHERPSLKSRGPDSQLELKPGMVITIEPGIYLPQIGGVRLEDTLVITHDGHRILTAD